MQPKQHIEVTFASAPMMGHFMPLLPFAEELLRRGHRVTFVHSSDPKYRSKLERCGLGKCTSVTYEVPPGRHGPPHHHHHLHDHRCLNKNHKVASADASSNRLNTDSPSHRSPPPKRRSMYDCILSHFANSKTSSEQPRAVIVYESFSIDAADAADQLGIPAVCVLPNMGVVSPRWDIAPPANTATLSMNTATKIGAHLLWQRLVLPAAEGLLARIFWLQRSVGRCRRGLWPLVEQEFYPTPYQSRQTIGCTSPALEFCEGSDDETHASSNLLVGVDTFTMVGPSLTSSVDPIDVELTSWMAEQSGRKLVYVAFGTMVHHTPEGVEHLLDDLLLYCNTHNASILWSLRPSEREHLHHAIPSHIRMQSNIPQVAVLRSGQVHLFVTHCGANSIYEAILTSQVPMVCCPCLVDQPGNARRVVKLGLGVMAKKGGRQWEVSLALERANENYDAMKQAAKNISDSFEVDGGASRAASVIEDVALGRLERKSGKQKYRFPLGILLLAAAACSGPAVGLYGTSRNP